MDFHDHPQHLRALFDAALQAADPGEALRRAWPFSLNERKPLYVVGAGKGSFPMANMLANLAGGALAGGVIATVPEHIAGGWQPASFTYLPAAHPLPDARNLHAAQAIKVLVESLGPADTLIALISGGGSAHLTLPAGELSLENLRDIARALMRAGAPIQHLNAVRKHCEVLKGGGLARLAAPAAIQAFVLSDVLGDPLDVISSGLTAPDPTTYADALDVLGAYDLLEAVPPVTAHLRAGAAGHHPETPKPGDPIFERVTHTIIGNNTMSLGAVRRRAARMGWRVHAEYSGIQGEARTFGHALGLELRSLAGQGRPACIIAGGETTVTVKGQGTGGRSQELALAAAIAIEGLAGVAVGAFCTDGIDGPTDAAGAIVTGGTCAQARAQGLDPLACLADNDSFTLLDAVGALVRTGPTGTNVNDVVVGLVY